MSESAKRQSALGRMMLDEAFEARVRSEPARVAEELSLPLAFVLELAAISAERVRAFRASQRHKDAVRGGKPPTKLRW
jgi:hypothetical protein